MTTLAQRSVDRDQAYPPRISEFTRPFWQALRDGRWTTTGCKKCQTLAFPPKSVCPHCWSTDVEWREWSHRGTLYSWTRIHAAPSSFAEETPYCVGIVDLDDGLRIACRLVDDHQPIEPGRRVEMLVLQHRDGPMFAARVLHPQDLQGDKHVSV